MPYPEAEHWCFEFSWVMFRNTFMEDTRAENVNGSNITLIMIVMIIIMLVKKGLVAILDVPVSPGRPYLGPGLP